MTDEDKFVERIRVLDLGCFGEDEIRFVYRTIQTWMPDAVYEWGTNRGSSARVFHEAGCHPIHTIDLPAEIAPIDRDHAGVDTAKYIEGLPVFRHHGDGVTVALTICAQEQPERPLFFLDGDHSYENVVRELRYIRRCAPHGCILVHDTKGHPGEAVRNTQRGYREMLALPSQAGMMRLLP